MTNKVDTSLWDIEAKQHSKRVYFNKPQLLTQYIGAKTTVIVAGRRTGKTDSKYIHISPKINMLYGYDQMGDVESVDVERFDAFLLSYIATMFFGVQFESIDKRRLKVVELAGL